MKGSCAQGLALLVTPPTCVCLVLMVVLELTVPICACVLVFVCTGVQLLSDRSLITLWLLINSAGVCMY